MIVKPLNVRARIKLIVVVVLVLFFCLAPVARADSLDDLWGFVQCSITTEDIKDDIRLIAHEAMTGRGLGTVGADYMSYFLARELRRSGWRPLGEKNDSERTYFQTFRVFSWSHQVEIMGNSRNVLGYVEGEIKDEFIIIGAHYDHLGVIKGQTYLGADDNGSGVCALLEIAEAYSELARDAPMLQKGIKPRRSIIIAFWSGEEEGLVGSKYFVNHLPPEVSLKKIALVINLDMVGRNDPKDIYVESPRGDEKSFTEAYGDLVSLLKEANNYVGLHLRYATDDEASDHAAFTELRPTYNIPVLCFWTGYHADYHKPTDTWDKVNCEKVRDVARLAFLVSWKAGQK